MAAAWSWALPPASSAAGGGGGCSSGGGVFGRGGGDGDFDGSGGGVGVLAFFGGFGGFFGFVFQKTAVPEARSVPLAMHRCSMRWRKLAYSSLLAVSV